MAEPISTSSALDLDSDQPPAERVADTQPEQAPTDVAPAESPGNLEGETGGANKQDERLPGSTAALQEQKESSGAQSDVPNASAEPLDVEVSATPSAPEAPDATSDTPAQSANGPSPSVTRSKSSKQKSSGITDYRPRPTKKKLRPTHLDAKPGEYYLARLRSYPLWPSIICDEDMLPETLLKTRPVTAMRSDGTYREDYADGGKRAHERTFPVMFFGTNEFAWIPNTDLEPTDAATCKDVPEKSQNKSILKNKSLVNAYTVAGEGHDLQFYKDMLADHERAIQQEIQAQEDKAAAKAEKQSRKSKRKGTDAVDEEDVEMEDVDEAAKMPKKSSRKRKKETDTDGEGAKPAKTPKTKLKLTTPKTPGSEAETKASGRAKRSSRAKKAAEGISSDEDGSELEAKEPEKQIDPEELRAKRRKEVLYIRHRLQRGFIVRDQPPPEEEMATMVNFFNRLESYTDLEVSIIRSTKIHRVLKLILRLTSIPKDEEFHFRQRAMDILSKWGAAVDADSAGAAGERQKSSKSTSNGLDKEGGIETPTKTDTEELAADTDVTEKVEAPEQELEQASGPVAEVQEAETTEEKEEVTTEEVGKAEEKPEKKSVEATA